MRFKDEKTSEVHKIFPTDEFLKDIQHHEQKFSCNHANKEVRRRTVGGGGIQIRIQCLICGQALGSAIKKEPAHNSIPMFDEAMEKKIISDKNLAHYNICKKHVDLQKQHEASHQKEYAEYLTSKVWIEKRQKVIERAGGLCEGCRTNLAEEVHHLTYDHIYEEFLFELVALCRPCHQRIHNNESIEITDEIPDYYEAPCCDCRHQMENKNDYWCGIFDVSIKDAMAEDGGCGPKRRALEGLK